MAMSEYCVGGGGGGGGEGGKEFTVTVKKVEVVAAALPMQDHWLPLSNLDLLLPPVDVGVFFCYKNPTTTRSTTTSSGGGSGFASMVATLKKGLAQALVSYYALAGEVVSNSVGEPELLCNNHGVEFVEAFAGVELQQLNLYNPDETIEGKFVPHKKHGVLAIQATELKCGGWPTLSLLTPPIGCPLLLRRDNHRHVSDDQCSTSRRPGSIPPSLNDMYIPVSMLPPPKQPQETQSDSKPEPESDHLISRIYYVTADQINKIQSLANSNSNNTVNKRTKLESFSAFLWQLVAKSAISESNHYYHKNGKKPIARMGMVVDGRTRLKNKSNKELMDNYFGNVLSIPFGEMSAEELTEKPLSWVADEVHEFLEEVVTEEHFLGLIDWVEAHRPVLGVAKVYAKGSVDGPGFVVSSGQRFPESKVDFGWGRPIFGSYHFPWGGDSGYVMPMGSPAGNGDWVVYMHLWKGQLAVIEKEAPHVFRPLTWDYLKTCHN
ncbi:HXXXD-type acyl-transferase family protein [Quillaja saponaria]|uniref:HXXXD-type acyl-transferase family protein n=1 Tax=Quillaja saponaria TaxID=32244 RepID=A0AAD7PH35_QUISA|nr:HXXXD-type acyl-transferase family protein [Quillaja saponaria]